MLQSIRDRTQGWIAGIIISILILSFALWGIHSYLGAGGDTSVVAKVNDVPITKNQLQSAYERLRRQAQSSNASPNVSEKVENNLKQQALKALIDIQVLKSASLKEGFKVSSRQIDGFLESMPEFQVNGQFSLARFQEMLSTIMFSAGEFLELIKTTLLVDQPRLGLLLSSFALPDEINNNIALINQERDIEYTIFPRTNFQSKITAPTSDEIAKYYQSHQDEFKMPEQVSLEYIELKTKDLADKMHPTDEAIKSYYTENINTYTEPMQWKFETIYIPLTSNLSADEINQKKKLADEIYQKVNSGADFASYAHQYPDTSNLKLNDWISLNQLPVEFQKAVTNLKKQKAISEPIRYKNALYILTVADFKDASIQPFDAVKDKISDTLKRQQAEEKFAEYRETLADISYNQHPESLNPAATTLGLTVKTTPLFSKDNTPDASDISSNRKIREAAFNSDVLNTHNNSDVITLDAETAVVIRVKSHLPATTIPLKDVESKIVTTLSALKADELAKKSADEVNQSLQKNSAETIASQLHVNWDQAGFIGRYATKIDSAILDAAFRLAKPTQNVPVHGVVKTSDGYAVVLVKAARDGVQTKKDQYDVFADQSQSSMGLLEYKLYTNSLTKSAKIQIENN